MISENVTSSAPAGACQPPLTPLATLVLWVGCLLAGVVGLAAGQPDLRAQAPQPAPVEMRVVQVDLPAPPPAPADASDPPAALGSGVAPSPAGDTVRAVAVPDLPAVALPGPGIAFAVPVEGPVRIVAAQAAAVVPRIPAVAARSAAAGIGPPGIGHRATPPAPAQVARLTLGQGEGDQPRPEYPREAILGRQEGTVQVRLGVGADGQVLWAQAVERCPWPLLNQAALRTVREEWHFPAGPARVYDVAIEFRLHRSDTGEP